MWTSSMGLNGMILHKDHLTEEPGIALKWKKNNKQKDTQPFAMTRFSFKKNRFVQIKINALRFHFLVFSDIVICVSPYKIYIHILGSCAVLTVSPGRTGLKGTQASHRWQNTYALAAKASPCLTSICPKERVKRLCWIALAVSGTGAWAPWPSPWQHSSASLGTDSFTGHSGTCRGSRHRYSSKANSERGPHRARLLDQSLQEEIPGAWLRGHSRGFPSGFLATWPSGLSLQGWLWAAFPSRDSLLLSTCPPSPALHWRLADEKGAAGGGRRAPSLRGSGAGKRNVVEPHTILGFNHGESCPPAMLSKPRKKKDKEQLCLRRQGWDLLPDVLFGLLKVCAFPNCQCIKSFQ